jgi:hypothetical protein
MRKFALCLAVAAMFALGALAQDNMGSMGSTPSTTSTSSKKATKSASKAKTEHQVTGCLSGPNSEGTYLLTNGRYRKGLEVGGDADLKSHVGHKVTLMGAWATGEEIDENEKSESKTEKTEAKSGMEKHFKVTAIKMISDKCVVPTATAKKSKKSSSAPTT